MQKHIPKLANQQRALQISTVALFMLSYKQKKTIQKLRVTSLLFLKVPAVILEIYKSLVPQSISYWI